MDEPRTAESLTDYLDDELTVLPDALDITQAAEQLAALFAANEGATFSLYFGDMANGPYIAVSIYQDRQARYSKSWGGNSLSPLKVRAIVTSGREFLRDPRNSIGVWYDMEMNKTYLEITATLPFRDKSDYTEAVRQGKRYNQRGVYDLEERAYIGLGGTGELPEGVLPVPERLPPLERGHKHE